MDLDIEFYHGDSPDFDDNVRAYICDLCDGDILVGDDFYRLHNLNVCEKCVSDSIRVAHPQ